MRTTSRVSGIAIVTALVLMGAGCMSPSSPPKPAEPVPAPMPSPVLPPETDPPVQDGSSAGGSPSGGAPVTGYEDDVSNPSQNY